MNPNKTKHYKRISNWLLVLAVILFIAGIAILVGPAVVQENELNTAAQEYEQLKGLADRLRSHIVGQDEAVDAVSKAIRRNRVGISPKKKPVSFMIWSVKITFVRISM